MNPPSRVETLKSHEEKERITSTLVNTKKRKWVKLTLNIIQGLICIKNAYLHSGHVHTHTDMIQTPNALTVNQPALTISQSAAINSTQYWAYQPHIQKLLNT